MPGKLAIIVCLGLSLGSLVGGEIVNEKAVLEKIYQKRVEDIAEKIVGIKDLIVVVDISPNEQVLRETQNKKIEPVETNSPKPQPNVYSAIGLPPEMVNEYMPGIPESEINPNPVQAQNYTAQPVNEQMQRSVSRPALIKKIAITVIVSNDVLQSDITRLKTEVDKLLGFDARRGDVIDIRQSFFKKNWQDAANSWLGFLTPHIYWVFGLLIVIVFLFGPLNSFFKSIIRAVEVVRIEANTRLHSQGSLEVGRFGEGQMETKQLADESRKQLAGGKEKRFGFINEENLKSLIYLVANEPPAKIALISAYLNADLSSQVIAALPVETQSQVMLEIATVKQSSPEEVILMEEDLKNRIEFMRGGVDHFVEIIDHVDQKTQERLLYQLREVNPDLADKVERKIFRFDQIAELSDKIIQALVRESGIPAFAIALKGTSQAIKNKVAKTISKGAAEMLKQEMELSGEIPAKRIESAQRLIVDTFRRMEKTGLIELAQT
ncbi:MAG: FliG C-terminal domain-containing protein [Elusimicrobiota bacterium]